MVEGIKTVAEKFFEACEAGRGWGVCSEFCSQDAAFNCDVLPTIKTLKDYTEWMKGLIENIAPDGKWDLLSCTFNENQVVYCAVFSGTHSKDGGPVKPSDPPKKTKCDYTYIIDFKDGKISQMRKIWDQLTAFRLWGWPLN